MANKTLKNIVLSLGLIGSLTVIGCTSLERADYRQKDVSLIRIEDGLLKEQLSVEEKINIAVEKIAENYNRYNLVYNK